jgi:hypothetical protein
LGFNGADGRVYDFAEYDNLVAVFIQHGITPYLILDYGNPLYDEGRAPVSPTAVAALATFATAAVRRYRGQGVIWEFWNEPNIGTGTKGNGYMNATAYGAVASSLEAGFARGMMEVRTSLSGMPLGCVADIDNPSADL